MLVTRFCLYLGWFDQLYKCGVECSDRKDGKGPSATLMTFQVQELRGHSNFVQGVAWDPRGEYAVTASLDRSLRIYQKVAAAYSVRISHYSRL